MVGAVVGEDGGDGVVVGEDGGGGVVVLGGKEVASPQSARFTPLQKDSEGHDGQTIVYQ